MVLKEAFVGGTIYLSWIKSEMALPEAERVAFDYGPISNRARLKLLHGGYNEDGTPDQVAICIEAIDKQDKKIRNLKNAQGEPLDTIEKVLDANGNDPFIAYMLTFVGNKIWAGQRGSEVGLKNSK
jgi:hypothetical protein